MPGDIIPAFVIPTRTKRADGWIPPIVAPTRIERRNNHVLMHVNGRRNVFEIGILTNLSVFTVVDALNFWWDMGMVKTAPPPAPPRAWTRAEIEAEFHARFPSRKLSMWEQVCAFVGGLFPAATVPERAYNQVNLHG